jgi:diaminopimelate epimerase
MTTAVEFAKYHALGNDYIVIDPNSGFVPTPENARLVCDRHLGLGGDGVLFGPLSGAEPFRLRTFNADGTECAKSGNGLRIFGRYLREHGYTTADELTVATADGPTVVRIVDLDRDLVRVDLGRATLDSTAVGATGGRRDLLREPLAAAGEELTATCVYLGTPHCVVVLDGDEVTAERVCALGPVVRDHDHFTDRINLELVHPVDRAAIRIEIFERGAGYTLASGSSACAAAFATHVLGLTGPRVAVHMPGGRVDVEIGDTGDVVLTGPVEPVLVGTWAGPLRRLLRTV